MIDDGLYIVVAARFSAQEKFLKSTTALRLWPWISRILERP
jgi:hypothetical protein